jgi:hypothetical protein
MSRYIAIRDSDVTGFRRAWSELLCRYAHAFGSGPLETAMAVDPDVPAAEIRIYDLVTHQWCAPEGGHYTDEDLDR